MVRGGGQLSSASGVGNELPPRRLDGCEPAHGQTTHKGARASSRRRGDVKEQTAGCKSAIAKAAAASPSSSYVNGGGGLFSANQHVRRDWASSNEVELLRWYCVVVDIEHGAGESYTRCSSALMGRRVKHCPGASQRPAAASSQCPLSRSGEPTGPAVTVGWAGNTSAMWAPTGGLSITSHSSVTCEFHQAAASHVLPSSPPAAASKGKALSFKSRPLPARCSPSHFSHRFSSALHLVSHYRLRTL